jgi:hypothetical protein
MRKTRGFKDGNDHIEIMCETWDSIGDIYTKSLKYSVPGVEKMRI